jgi:acetylornithine deacetylase
VERAVDGVATLEWAGGAFHPGETPLHHPFTALVGAAAEDVLARPVPRVGVPYGADLRLFTARGIPCLILGPGDVRLAHTAAESVPVDELVASARIHALAALRFLGAG